MTGRIQKSAKAREALGQRIKSLRRRKGWSQLALAFQSGLSPASLSKIELGRNAKVANLAKIAWALGITLSRLFQGVSQEFQYSAHPPTSPRGKRP